MCSFMIKHIQTPSKMSDLKTYRCMAYTLLEEVANPQLTFEMCEALMDGCVDKLMGADVQHHRRTLLAVAVCIIGSHRNEYFQLAFKFTTEWEWVGGCYWVVQRELLKQLAIFELKMALRECSTEKSLMDALDYIIDECAAEVRQSRCLKEGIEDLRDVLHSLTKTAAASSDPLRIFNEYAATYPMDKFTAWYISWSQNILKRTEGEDFDVKPELAPLTPLAQLGQAKSSKSKETPPRGGIDDEAKEMDLSPLTLDFESACGPAPDTQSISASSDDTVDGLAPAPTFLEHLVHLLDKFINPA